MTSIRLRYGHLLAPELGPRGLEPERLTGNLQERFAAALEAFESRRSGGELGFLDLPVDEALARQVSEVADSFGQWFENLVVVGIGGSSLGGRALAGALLGAGWNERTDEERDHFPRLYFLENADPDSTHELLSRLDLRRTLFNVISKSGGTSETLAQLQIIEERLNAAVGAEGARGHLIFTTDPEQGELRRLSNEKGIPALPVPSNVGGRFSVLSPVGLLPAAITGIDIASLLAGAAEMADRCRAERLTENPAGMLATLLHAADEELGCRTHVLMPYADRLQVASLWFQQLWAESLGKRHPGSAVSAESEGGGGAIRLEAGVGPTPLAALGAVDQHSLLQLLMEGPADKVVVFVRVRARDVALPIPALHPEYTALSLLGGHTLEELLDMERRATTEALRKSGRPSLTLEMERLDARSFGAFLMLFQIATVIAGELYGVNPLDQPGVELSKVLTRQLLSGDGSTGADDDLDGEDWWV